MPGYAMMRGHPPNSMMPGYGAGMHNRGMGPMSSHDGQPTYLHLSPEQRQAWAKQWQESAGQEQKLHNQLYRRMTHMQNMMAQPSADPEAVGQAFDEMTAAQRKLLMERIRARQRFDAILTPQQRKAWYRAGAWCPNGACRSWAEGQ
ncbi:periplasmic heavy metal sensor [Salinisphaera sp. SPP-AMP-43]|uniref:Spy/CpxP family protein refolding chaperone n=1 Tax=Salinisphaera sp. SPP-AMP-43 TaxID=3121288 RepID=UPI003C6E9AAA